MKKFLIIILPLLWAVQSFAQDTSLARHSFAYVGEWDTRKPDRQSLFILKDGHVTFQYCIPMHDRLGRIQEFDDIKVLPNGNIVYAAMSQLGMIDPEGKLLWQFICPVGTESHSCQPLDEDRVYFALNGVPGKIVIWNIKTDTL